MTKANSIDNYIPSEIDILEEDLKDKDCVIAKQLSKINILKAIVRKKNKIIEKKNASIESIEYKDNLLRANETTIESLCKQLQESSSIIEKLIEKNQ